MYQSLVDFEKRLDATIMRKRLDAQELLRRPMKVRLVFNIFFHALMPRCPQMKRTLRIFVSNLAASQSWSNEVITSGEGGDGIPSWTLKIEGRLLDAPNSGWKKPAQRKFSSFVSRVIVELQRDPEVFPQGNLIEWRRPVDFADTDGFEVKRAGDAEVKCRIHLFLDHRPVKYALQGGLAELLGMQIESRPTILMALWQYIKTNRLQSAEDRMVIKLDAPLQKVSVEGGEGGKVGYLCGKVWDKVSFCVILGGKMTFLLHFWYHFGHFFVTFSVSFWSLYIPF